MKLGSHISIAGGFDKMIDKAVELNCKSVQFFASNPRGWGIPPLNKDVIDRYIKLKHKTNIEFFVVHLPYLPNISTSDVYSYRKSVAALKDNLDRAAALEADYLVVHPGNSLSVPLAKAIGQAASAINIALCNSISKVKVLVENTAGQGTQVGFTFKQLSEILDKVKNKKRIGICLDTAHLYGAGYDISASKKLDKVINEFKQFIDIEYLKVIHLNDTNSKLGSNIDRHENIGKGNIGVSGFQAIINHPLLKSLPGIIETPKKDYKEDQRNLNILRSLIK